MGQLGATVNETEGVETQSLGGSAQLWFGMPAECTA